MSLFLPFSCICVPIAQSEKMSNQMHIRFIRIDSWWLNQNHTYRMKFNQNWWPNSFFFFLLRRITIRRLTKQYFWIRFRMNSITLLAFQIFLWNSALDILVPECVFEICNEFRNWKFQRAVWNSSYGFFGAPIPF